MPSSMARWRPACMAAGSSGSPHTSLPGSRMAPKPSRLTVKSPSVIVSGPWAKRSIELTMSHRERAGTVGRARLTLTGDQSPPAQLDGERAAPFAGLTVRPDLGEPSAQLVERGFAFGGDVAAGGRPSRDVADQLV